MTALHRDALQRLMSYSWPGNVREVRNVLEWAVITAQKDLILPSQLPKTIDVGTPPVRPTISETLRIDLGRTLDEVETEYIAETLKSLNNDLKRTAQVLGISILTLYNRRAESKEAAKTAS